MKKSILSLLLLIAANTLLGQTFEKTYGTNYESTSKVIQAIDGGYIIASSTQFPGAPNGTASDILIIKTDTNGVMQWSERMQSVFDDDAMSIEADTDSTYLVCGNAYDNNSGKLNVFVIRMGLTGNIINQKLYKSYDAERAAILKRTSDGGYIIVGETLFNGSDLQIYLLKIDHNLDIQWSHAYGDPDVEYGTNVIPTPDNGYIVTGVSRINSYSNSICVVKVDSTGNRQWFKKYNTTPVESKCLASCVLSAADNGYVICGATDDNQAPVSFFAMNIDTLGGILWQKVYRTTDIEFTYDAISDNTGFTLCGSANSLTGPDKIMFFNIDALGNLQWQLGYQITDSTMTPTSLLKLPNRKYLICGVTDATAFSTPHVLLIQSDSTYNQELCNQFQPALIAYNSSLVALSVIDNAVDTTVTLTANYTIASGVQEEVKCIGGTVSTSEINMSVHSNIYEDAQGNIILDGETGSGFISIYNLEGQLLQKFNITGNNLKEIILSHDQRVANKISDGLFVFEIQCEKEVYSQKLVLHY